ncbi:hypothetical protein F3J23_07410 [Chryseobacterium sp. Tr-659]|uniref:hypothetical protein n=1 Tax=Chryseobacterium sp. Tr-659 TaxID=2608340 RepID=UPI001421C7CE|nr:hypothetical protein [Chryseobacterium sp. Tr-659]NIF05269.1 hypothetical protein [Chryseobacterium sp. Tr-659]
MYSITKKINPGKKALVAKNVFINDETIPSSKTQFICCDCSHENTIEIIPYQSGFPIFQIYDHNRVLSKEELLINNMTHKTSESMIHFGELTVNDLPTLYFGTACKTCPSKYICVFSYGERQPGLTVLNISGIWKYEESV